MATAVLRLKWPSYAALNPSESLAMLHSINLLILAAPLSLAPATDATGDPLEPEVQAPLGPKDPPRGMRAPSTYLHLSPGLGAWESNDSFLMYGWGVGAGRHLVRGRRFALQFGGFFEHLVRSNPVTFRSLDDTTSLHHIRLGPELRIGGSNERLFGYGLLRAGLNVIVVGSQFNTAQSHEAVPSFVATLGAGIQGALGPRRRVLLGIEPGADFGVFDTRLNVTVRLRAILGFRF